MTAVKDLLNADNRELRSRIAGGHPVDPAALEGWAYRGTSLGLPRFVERLTWKTFQKTFYRDPTSGRLLGWNVRLEQDGVDAPSRPKMRHGRPVTEWNYEVIEPAGVPAPRGFARGLVIDYSRAPNPPGLVRLTKDPLVALVEGSADELLGVSYLVLGDRCIETPTYFTLQREHPIDYVPFHEPEHRRLDPLRLSGVERAWAEALMEAIVATGGEDGLPAFASIDRATFWRCFDEAPGPVVRAGLRPMVYTLTFLPAISGFGRPFFALAAAERAAFLDQVSGDSRTFVRQALMTMKTLACFAYFDHPMVRERFEAAAPPGAGL